MRRSLNDDANELTLMQSLWIDDHAFFELPFYFRFPPNRPWEPSPAERLKLANMLVEAPRARAPPRARPAAARLPDGGFRACCCGAPNASLAVGQVAYWARFCPLTRAPVAWDPP